MNYVLVIYNVQVVMLYVSLFIAESNSISTTITQRTISTQPISIGYQSCSQFNNELYIKGLLYCGGILFSITNTISPKYPANTYIILDIKENSLVFRSTKQTLAKQYTARDMELVVMVISLLLCILWYLNGPAMCIAVCLHFKSMKYGPSIRQIHVYLGATNSCERMDISYDGIGIDASTGAIKAGRSVSCDGHRSCESATVNSANEARFYGSLSGYKAEINDVPFIKASGYQSLKEALIVKSAIKDNAAMVINLFGYEAGKGAKIVCKDRTKCTLRCQGTGCHGAEFQCEPRATCSVIPAACGNNAQSNVDGIICPTLTDGSGNVKQSVDLINVQQDEQSMDQNVDESFIEDENEPIIAYYTACNIESECEGESINDPFVNCFGKTACLNTDITTPGATNSDAINCDGENSCKNSIITAPTGTLTCSGIDNIITYC